MLITPRTYQQLQSLERESKTAGDFHFPATVGWHVSTDTIREAQRMLLVHQVGSVKIGEVVRCVCRSYSGLNLLNRTDIPLPTLQALIELSLHPRTSSSRSRIPLPFLYGRHTFTGPTRYIQHATRLPSTRTANANRLMAKEPPNSSPTSKLAGAGPAASPYPRISGKQQKSCTQGERRMERFPVLHGSSKWHRRSSFQHPPRSTSNCW